MENLNLNLQDQFVKHLKYLIMVRIIIDVLIVTLTNILNHAKIDVLIASSHLKYLYSF